MNRRAFGILALLAILGTSGVGLYVLGLSGLAQPGYPLERTIRYGFTVENTKSRPLEVARFRTYAPVKLTPTQKLVGLEASHPYKVKTDSLGNRILRFRLKDIPPNGQVIVRITVHLRLSEKPNRMEKLAGREDLLKPSPLAPADHPRLMKLAQRLAGSSSIETLRGTQRWAVNNIAYQGYLAEDRGALYALDQGTGDCTEAMSLVLALLRANEIPALGVAGFPTTQSQVLHPEGFHNWAMVWPGKSFWITDPVNERLEEGIPGYIAFRLLLPGETRSPGFTTQSFYQTEQDSVAIRMTD
ncbi:transglutaminase-like domain-containing protein [Thiohalorhabdus sp. Cl-TMA]|uniref:Transglutaminase family protein n=1 Tax=Thiohalorhabdus methylotrophus TaxID=3242694 RepID=A0ABV4TUM6_9GAMM